MSQKTPIDVPSVNDVQIAKQCIMNILKRHDKVTLQFKKTAVLCFLMI